MNAPPPAYEPTPLGAAVRSLTKIRMTAAAYMMWTLAKEAA